MLNKFLVVSAIVALSLIANSCSDDCVTCYKGPLVGTWILHSSGTEGNMQLLPDDTLKFYSNGTGIYRPELGWGLYDFTYSVRNDTIFQAVTEGQSVGAEYARKYEIRSDSLHYVDESGTVPVYTLWLRE